MKFRHKSIWVTRVILSLLTLSLIVFIFLNSAQSAAESSASSGRVMAFLNSITSSLGLNFVFTQQIVRTSAHFCEFGLLGVLSTLTLLSFLQIKSKTFFISVAVFSLTALVDECIQLFSEGRAFQLSDLIVDITGGLLGAIAVYLISLLVQNHKIKASEKVE